MFLKTQALSAILPGVDQCARHLQERTRRPTKNHALPNSCGRRCREGSRDARAYPFMESSMAHGQIDPARLEGDALNRWYLRSPADVEAERSRAADRAYREFFAPSEQRDPEGKQQAEQYEVAAAAPPRFWDYWSLRGCRNCHGYTPETLPPVGGHSPLPPGYSPRTGGSGGSGGVPRQRGE